jgi:hypothetical protein
MICQASKGFLTMAPCGSPAATACSNCGRTMCTAHLSPTSGFSTCYDCAATQQQSQEGEPGEYDDTWAHGYRSSYYSSSGYRPVSSYDRQDSSSFDARRDDEFDEETERGFDAS